jgi:hypothetical protein
MQKICVHLVIESSEEIKMRQNVVTMIDYYIQWVCVRLVTFQITIKEEPRSKENNSLLSNSQRKLQNIKITNKLIFKMMH